VATITSLTTTLFSRFLSPSKRKATNQGTSNTIQTVDFDYNKMASANGTVLKRCFEDLADNNADNLERILEWYGESYATQEFHYPMSSQDLLSNVACYIADLEELPPNSYTANQAKASLTDEVSAELSQFPVTGPVLSYDSAASSDYFSNFSGTNSSGDIQNSTGAFSTKIAPKFNNFLPIQIPYYSNVLAQKICGPGDYPIFGSTRAIARASISAAALGTTTSTNFLNSNNASVQHLGVDPHIAVPAYGYYGDGIFKMYHQIPQSVSSSFLGTSGVKLGIAAADNFSYGEFIGIPPVKMAVMSIYSDSSDKRPLPYFN